jgi:hypothetical protein
VCDVRTVEVGIVSLLIEQFLLFVFSDGKRVLELLGEVLVDRLAGLEDGSTVFEAFYLFEDEAGSIDFIFFAAIDGDDAFSVLLLFVR